MNYCEYVTWTFKISCRKLKPLCLKNELKIIVRGFVNTDCYGWDHRQRIEQDQGCLHKNFPLWMMCLSMAEKSKSSIKWGTKDFNDFNKQSKIISLAVSCLNCF
jgi:hypothetical protein